jgi:hypothetical protein
MLCTGNTTLWGKAVARCSTNQKPANNNANNAKNGLRVIILTEKQLSGITRKTVFKIKFRVIVKLLKSFKNNNAKKSTPYRGIKALRG